MGTFAMLPLLCCMGLICLLILLTVLGITALVVTLSKGQVKVDPKDAKKDAK